MFGPLDCLDCVSIETSAGYVVCANQPVSAVVYTANHGCFGASLKFNIMLPVGCVVLPLLCGFTGSTSQQVLAQCCFRQDCDQSYCDLIHLSCGHIPHYTLCLFL